MHESKGVSTPMSSSSCLTLTQADSHVDITEYRWLLGKLQYLSFTRPDVSFAVNKLAQYMHCPQACHWQAVKRLLRYLKLTCSYGLKLSKSSDHTLRVYSDSDWDGNIDDRTSTTGYILYYGPNPISWCSKKQGAVACSSTEAEYRAVACALAETNWVTNLLQELKLPLKSPPRIFCDNVGVTYLCHNPLFHSRMKHIAIDFHFVRDQVQRNSVTVHHIHSADQVADTLTKPLAKSAFQRQFNKLALVTPMPNLRGHNTESSSTQENL